MKGNKSTITEILPLKSGVLHRLPLRLHYRGSGQFFLEDGKELYYILSLYPGVGGQGGGGTKEKEFSGFFFQKHFTLS